MEPIRGFRGPRALLPAEVEMCQALGITEEDYWTFCDLALARNGERREGYKLIPDIQNGPATPILIQLAIGIALTAIGVLLTPKPRSPQQKKAPPQLQTADATGPKRFATQAGFNAVQSVASLGETIPVVFANYNENDGGGVRVAARLLWSRMTSWTTTQQFEGIYLFSSGSLYARPDYYGYAIGDTLLSSYPGSKFRMLFAPEGGRLTVNVQTNPQLKGQYPETENTDTRIPGNGFEIYDKFGNANPDFCGTRTPSSQTQFGLYAPMPNGMGFQLPYELVLVVDGTGADSKNRAREKKEKLSKRFPVGAAITGVGGDIQQEKTGVTYTARGDLYTADTSWSRAWGVADIQQTQQSRLEEVDANIGVGNQYLIGQALAVCTNISPTEPWREGVTKTYTFETTENNPGANTLDIPEDGVDGLMEVYQNTTICRAAVGTVSNSRPCDQTEIGIRSKVWKQINFTNVNSKPSESTIDDYEEQGGNIQLGQVNKYINRFSFFGLQARKRGSDAWRNLSGVFCVQGKTPEDQYNYISIHHPRGQYEFRFVPIPGNNIWKTAIENASPTLDIWQLKHGNPQGPLTSDVDGDTFEVFFQGVKIERPYNAERFSNREWIKGPDIDDWGETLNAFDAIADYIKYEGETSSHLSAPEHEIVYVNEIIYSRRNGFGEFLPVYGADGPQYDDLAIAGLNLWSDKEWSSMSELSAFMRHGVNVTKPDGSIGPTNVLPEIVYALLTDESFGAGKLIGGDQVDAPAMEQAASYCFKNKFTWNGVLTDKVNLREWIFENAAYCLLDFTIIGGKFSLRPTPILNSDNTINRSGKPPISALFTDGSIRDLKVVFQSPEERKPFKAVCLYREDVANGFPETRAVTVSLDPTGPQRYPEEASASEGDPEETFDMTQFCTVKPGAYPSHPVTFAQTAIRTRTLVTHTVTFQTTPEMAMGLIPGQYFRLISAATHTSRFNNGVISEDGVITSTTPIRGGEEVYYWVPGTTEVREGTLTVAGGVSIFLRGVVFTLKTTVQEDRVYKVEALTYAEDGLVELTGSHVPLTESGALAIMDDRGFLVELA